MKGVSYESLDIRTKGVFDYFDFNGLINNYAPNADIVLPPETVIGDIDRWEGFTCNSIEFMNKNTNIYSYRPFRCSKIIYPEEATKIYGATYLNKGYAKADVDIYIRGPQKEILNFVPSDWKSVTWNYYD